MKNLIVLICAFFCFITTTQAQSAQGRLKGKGVKVNPVTIYWNTEQSYEATCPVGTSGTPVTATVLANTYSSPTSVSDANSIALTAARNTAEGMLSCSPTPTTYTNTEQSYTATCPSGYTGTSVTVTKAAGTYTSLVSVADANTLAYNAAMAESNASLVCSKIIYYNTQQIYTARCPSGYTGDSVTVTKAAGTYSSTLSVSDANTKALFAATSEATSSLTCTLIPPTYTNTEQSYTASCPSGYTGTPVTVTKAAGTYSSTLSVSDANAKALSAATAEAQAALTCVVIPTIYSNTSQSYTANCPTGTTGSSVTVTKAAGTYTSTISIADANAKALAAATSEANAQLVCVTDGFNLSAYPALPTPVTPGGSAPGDAFTCNAAASPSSSAPQISEWTRTDNTKTGSKATLISFTGENLSGIAANGVTVYDNSSIKQAVIGSISGQAGSIRLPASDFKFRVVWFENASGKGTPIVINKTEVWWAQTSVVAGGTASIFGRNLAHNNIEGTGNSYVYFTPTGGGARTQATVTNVTPYKVDYTVPAVANGTYYVWVHNGHGGDYGYSRTTVTVISASNHIKHKTFSGTVNVPAPSGNATTDVSNINTAVASAGTSGMTILFQSGVYQINGAINISNNTKWLGAKSASGAPLTEFRVVSSFNNAGEGLFNRSGDLNLVLLEGINMNCNGFTTDNANAALFDFNASTMVSFVDCYLNNRYLGNSMRIANGFANIYFENCTLTGGLSESEGNTFMNGGSQLFINNTRLYQTNDAESAIINRNIHEAALTGCTVQDLDNSTSGFPNGWGKGRIWSANGSGGSNYNLYFAKNLGQGLGTRMSGTNVPDPNSGEIFLWEGGTADGKASPTSATSTTVTFSGTVTTNGTMGIKIVAGKGKGQSRTVISGNGTNTITIDEAWKVTPDATSVIVYGPFPRRLVIYNNSLNANGKSYIANSATATASSGTNFYGGVSEGIFDGNIVTGTRAGVTLTPTQHDAALVDPNFFNDVINNTINATRYGISVQMGYVGVAVTPYTMLLCTNIDNNVITGTLPQTWNGISYVPDIIYSVSRGFVPETPPINCINISNCDLFGTNIYNWYQIDFGVAPTNLSSQMFSQQTLYNNF